jgi:hypothetical protein
MDIRLSDEESQVLREALDGVLREMSSEIAATDNASFRATIEHRRQVLRAVAGHLATN